VFVGVVWRYFLTPHTVLQTVPPHIAGVSVKLGDGLADKRGFEVG
jgi:hypothetical protein